jgi:hypothetical protein
MRCIAIFIIAALLLGSAQAQNASGGSSARIELPQAEHNGGAANGQDNAPAILRGIRTWESPFVLPLPAREIAPIPSPLLCAYCRWSRSSFS